MPTIRPFLIEYFLLGRTHQDALERYTQDGGIVTDVWLAFAAAPDEPQRVLIAPTRLAGTVVLGHGLHRAITDYRAWNQNTARESPRVSPLENFVAVTVYFDELLQIILPLTTWWHKKELNALRRKVARSGDILEAKLKNAIVDKLGGGSSSMQAHAEGMTTATAADEMSPDRRIIQAAPLAALIGVFKLAGTNPGAFAPIQALDPRNKPGDADKFIEWIVLNAEAIAEASRQELSRETEPALMALRNNLPETVKAQLHLDVEDPPELIQRVFLDRQAGLANTDANCTIKADAATRVFDVSCRDVTWAMIDSGIATSHPAFLDHGAKDRHGRPIVPPPRRIKATLDFTKIDLIRNFDLIAHDEGTPERAAAIAKTVAELEQLPGRLPDPAFQAIATRNLELIARQLEQRIPPDWNLIEPLIMIKDADNGLQLVSDHGTHVAGILAADWRSEKLGPDGKKPILLQGVCPDISLYDLRVIHPRLIKSTEFAVLAALEYVQFVNARAGSNGPLIHGVNISMSIPHDVRNYGCGATPVCVACDRLINAGVVVVAAAGNHGWNERELGFGNFVFCSITDPGNAREVITVGSTHRVKPHMFGVSYFSSRGPTGDGRVKPDLVAPGEQIRGPIRGGADDELDGTSMAAPFVSGAAAMLIARNRELIGNPARIKQILCASATDLGREKYFQGHGLVDVLRAMQSI
ncbi:MAG TPA: S8 family serine peptidase [Thermoanaerobaculia bacterium]|nr:S8 family serine peptidase [Thermoanaerobaculia bacterium]